MIPCCLGKSVGVIPRSPPAHGLTAGRRQRSGKRLTAQSGADECQYRAVGFHVGGTVRTAEIERFLPPARSRRRGCPGKPVVSAPAIEATGPRQRNGTIPALAVA